MTDDDRLLALLRSALPPQHGDEDPGRDLWPAVVGGRPPRRHWSSLDISVAAIVATTLLVFPDWVFFLAFHL